MKNLKRINFELANNKIVGRYLDDNNVEFYFNPVNCLMFSDGQDSLRMWILKEGENHEFRSLTCDFDEYFCYDNSSMKDSLLTLLEVAEQFISDNEISIQIKEELEKYAD